ncbi:MAG TPA: fumarylacetoacetase [Streptosporangiaceae bacterium]|jgi:fumarylacetoacetase
MTRSWVPGADGSGFGADHLPYGVFSVGGGAPRAGVRIGAYVLDLAAALGDDVFAAPALNPFLARGRPAWAAARSRVIGLLTDDARRAEAEPHLVPLDRVRTRLPVEVADYADFYCSLEHATNLGRILRPAEEPLKPNWRHLPVGYHGRAGTVVVSGTPVARPSGQRLPPTPPSGASSVGPTFAKRIPPGAPATAPVFGPSVRLDIEAELGFVVGAASRLGEPVATGAFPDHVFGVALVNDWSARDIQAWEYVPLGPFGGKSFATSMAAWITPLEALEPARVAGPAQEPPPLPYLARTGDWGLDLTLEVRLNGEVIARPPYDRMYWTPDQMLAQLTVTGASLRPGDLYASGTVSGPGPAECGSLIELTRNGADPLKLRDGTTRAFLEDGDEITITAAAPGGLTLAEVRGMITP